MRDIVVSPREFSSHGKISEVPPISITVKGAMVKIKKRGVSKVQK